MQVILFTPLALLAMHAQAAATQTTSKAKKVIQPRRDWHTTSDVFSKHNSNRLTGQFILDLFSNGFVFGAGYFCVHSQKMAQYLKNDTKMRLTKFQRQGCQLMTEELPLEVRLSFKRLGYRLLLDNSGFLQKVAAESDIQIPIEYLCDPDNDSQALAALGLLDGQSKPAKTKRAIPEAVIYHIHLLIHADTGGSGNQLQTTEQYQQVPYYYHSDESASPCISYESAEPASESQSLPSESDLHYACDAIEGLDSQPLSPTTEQLLLHELSDSQSNPDIYFDSQSTDLSLSSDSANFSSISIHTDLDLFSGQGYHDELLTSDALTFM